VLTDVAVASPNGGEDGNNEGRLDANETMSIVSVTNAAPRLMRCGAPGGPLQAGADRHGTTAGAVAVAWTPRNPAVDGAIAGFRRPGQVDPILAAAGLELTDEDVNEIEATK
jgi:aryl-alcohol dehydrogenase-like predicted oxidoreductase